jgi:hypothetical protein
MRPANDTGALINELKAVKKTNTLAVGGLEPNLTDTVEQPQGFKPLGA